MNIWTVMTILIIINIIMVWKIMVMERRLDVVKDTLVAVIKILERNIKRK